MDTEQEVEVKEKDIPNVEYIDRELNDSKADPNHTSRDHAVKLKKESRVKVENQYQNYRRRTQKKLAKKDRKIQNWKQDIKQKEQEVNIYESAMNNNPSVVQNYEDVKEHVDSIKEDIEKLRRYSERAEINKKIIVLNEERYFRGKFHRYSVTPIKLVKKLFTALSNTVRKMRNYFNVIDVDMDFDQESAEDMLNVGFNNSTVAAQPQTQAQQSQGQSQKVEDSQEKLKMQEVDNGIDSVSISAEPKSNANQIELAQKESVPEISSLPSSKESGYSVFDNGGDELATIEDINRMNQEEEMFLSQLNLKSELKENNNSGNDNSEKDILNLEPNSDVDDLLKKISQVYQEERERQRKLKAEAEERQKLEVEAKKQAEQAAEKEKLAREKEIKAKKEAEQAAEKEKLVKEALQLKLNEITRQVAQIRTQNEQLADRIEETSSNIDYYEKNRKTSEDNTTKILTEVEQTLTTIKEKNEVTDRTSTKIAELDQMLGISPSTFNSSEAITSPNNEMEKMMAEFKRDTGNLPNLNMDSMLSKSSNRQASNNPGAGIGPRR